MNILDLGLNVDTFNEEKLKRLQQFITLFDTLSKYDGKVYNPILGGGFVEFNNSIAETSKLLDEINVKVKNIGSGGNTSTATKQQTELSLAVNEYKKNADAAAVASAKLAVATSDQAKETMALKLQLSETSKALLDEAKANNELVQKKLALKQATIDQKNAEKQAAVDLKEEERQRVSALKAEAAMEELAAKAKIADDKAAQNLISDYAILKKSIQEQAIAYQNMYLNAGKNAPQTKQALADYKATSGIVFDIDKKLASASGSTKLFGGALSSAFGQLRTLAYILPGIGIAGLFNVAFEAIGKATEGMGLFTNKLELYLQYQTDINKSLSEEIALNEHLYELQRSLNNTTSENATFGRVTALKEAEGYDAITIAQRKAQQSSLDILKLETEIALKGNSPETLKKDLDRRLSTITDYANKITDIQARIDAIEDPNKSSKRRQQLRALGAGQNLPSGGLGVVKIAQGADPEILKKEKESLEAQKKVAEDSYKIDSANYDKVLSLTETYFKDRSALQKVTADQERRLKVETIREDISLEIERNQKIISNERSTQAERISAVKTIQDQTKRLNSINLFNVTDNISSTQQEKAIAQKKFDDENVKATLKANEQIDKITTDFYQRRIKAIAEINKTELDEQAIANERIFKNEENSFEQRLNAYNTYIALKQQMQRIEFEKDIQRGAKSEGGKTSLTNEEQVELFKQSATQQANIQADAEKQVYDIVYTSLQKQLKLIVDTNKVFEQNNKHEYAVELSDLNKSFEDKIIKYKAYKDARIILDNKYRLSGLTASIEDDNVEVKNLEDFVDKVKKLRDSAYNEMNDAKDKKDTASSRGDNDLSYTKNYDEALGKYKAYQTEVLNSEEELKKAEDKRDADELNRAKAKYEQLEHIEKEHAANRKAIEEGLYNLAKTYIDSEAQARLEALQRKQEGVDEQYESEIDAIQKSSLSAKDKTALDIQLNQQKKESDKNAQLEERKLKHDQAVLDREMTLAHIAWETEQAIMAAYSIPFIDPISATGLAIERGILGAIAAATVLATDIPAYEFGTSFHPGGWARTGEAGVEEIREPYKSPYLVLTETVSYLPRGTEVIPIKESPEFSETKRDNSWEQTRWLAKQIRANKQQIKNEIHPTIVVDMSTAVWAKKILGN